MTLTKQLWLAIATIMTIAFGISFLVSAWSAKGYLEDQLRLKNIDNANSLALSMSQTEKDPVLIELLLSAQFDIGGISFDSHLGLEISYFDKIAARIGSDIGNLTLGAGLNIRQFKIDLALRDHADLENSLLVSLNVRF